MGYCVGYVGSSAVGYVRSVQLLSSGLLCGLCIGSSGSSTVIIQKLSFVMSIYSFIYFNERHQKSIIKNPILEA